MNVTGYEITPAKYLREKNDYAGILMHAVVRRSDPV